MLEHAIELKGLIKSLGYKDADLISRQLRHFTEKEAERRDEIVTEYLGKEGIEKVVSTLSHEVVSAKQGKGLSVLDVGAGVGTFTVPMAERVRLMVPEAKFYALDVTPAMLEVLAKRAPCMKTFLGIAENIKDSVELWKGRLSLPVKFDAITSVLTLHHCRNIGKVFQSFGKVLKRKGRAIVIDLCRHTFHEFTEEMGDYHLGFELDAVRKASMPYFQEVSTNKLHGICCSSSDMSAELFLSIMKKPRTGK